MQSNDSTIRAKQAAAIMSPADFRKIAHELGREFDGRAEGYDRDDRFVAENYERLKAERIFSALCPQELGGGGVSHSDLCEFLRILGSYCPSTALALSMHQHLISATLWKYRHGQGGEAVLKKVAAGQLVLVSTGARDWLESNGTLEPVEGGFLLNARKAFASQSVVGDVMVTSARYDDPEQGAQVFHFSVPFAAEGVTVLDDWYTMGMRGTGSCTIQLQNVFVPEDAIVLRRPQGAYHQVWNLVLTVAMPLIMAVYVGAAEQAAELAIAQARKNEDPAPHVPYLLGELHNSLTTARVVWRNMVALANDLEVKPTDQLGQDILTHKTIVADACRQTVDRAIDLVGGQSFLRKSKLERFYRDLQASRFHPLPAPEQKVFSGNYLLAGLGAK